MCNLARGFSNPHIPLAILPALLTAAASSCATPSAARRIHSAFPDASYEATVQGCEWHPRAGGRRFGHDSRAAVLWARQVVGAARMTTCEVVVDAVKDGARYRVYEVVRDPTGTRAERVLVR
jgi:hypothetical protein